MYLSFLKNCHSFPKDVPFCAKSESKGTFNGICNILSCSFKADSRTIEYTS